MLFVTIQCETALLLKTVKCMLYLGYVLLRYILIYDLEVHVSFNFHLDISSDISTIECV